jgi:serine/threonine-protein kinase
MAAGIADATSILPRRFGRYAVLGHVADGGMGSVYLGRAEGAYGFERLVAIKTIRRQFGGDERFRQMFLDEVRILSRIEHPNVARVFDVGADGDAPYLVLEWIDGDSVAALLRAANERDEPLPLSHAIRIVAEACSGLHAAHELADAVGRPLGVVHRDVSPQNILVSTGGDVKVIDFGVAKARDRLAETRDGTLKGRINYMAPEHVLGREVDRRADVFALGALLYELLSGRAPYAASNEAATLHQLVQGEPPVPLPASVPPGVARVVSRALGHDPAERYATADELRRALLEAVDPGTAAAARGDLASLTRRLLAERIDARRTLVRSATGASMASPASSARHSTLRRLRQSVGGAIVGATLMGAVVLSLVELRPASGTMARAPVPSGAAAIAAAPAPAPRTAPASPVSIASSASSESVAAPPPAMPHDAPAPRVPVRRTVPASVAPTPGPRHKDYGI